MASRKQFGKPMDFPCGLTQLQWCTSTLQFLEEEMQKSHEQITIEHTCVARLLDGLLSPCRQSVQAICLVLVDATIRGLIAYDPVIKYLISSCSSMLHWAVCVCSLGKILFERLLASIKSSGCYTCPYSLRTSPHPFISVFNSRPESGVCIADVAVEMLTKSASSNCFESALQLMSPLLKYFLVHPSPSSDHMMISSHLHTSLLLLVESLHDQCENVPSGLLLLHTLTDLLPLTPTSNNQHILTLSNRIKRLTHFWRMFGELEMVTKMVDSCLAACCKLIDEGLSLEPLLGCVLQLLTLPPKVQLLEDHIFCLAWLMFQSLLTPSVVHMILHIVVESHQLDPRPCVLLMLLPVVQVLSRPHHFTDSTLQKSAYSIMQAIQKTTSYIWKPADAKPMLPLSYQPYPLFQSLTTTLSTISSSSVAIVTWLYNTTCEQYLSKLPHSSLEVLTLMLSVLFARGLSFAAEGEQVLQAVTKLFVLLTSIHPIISPSLLPLFLYFLPLISSPSRKLTLLYTLPSLATHHFAIGPTANVLRALARNSALLPVSLRLMGKLWIEHDSVFPHITFLLAQRKVPMRITSEFDITKALVIKDICCIRAEHHGEEMLGHISVLLEQARPPLATALAIDAMAALCQCNVIDPVSVWSVVENLLHKEQRIPVAVAACSVLGLASNVDSEQRFAAKKFKTAALKQLWKMAFSPYFCPSDPLLNNTQSHEVCSAALDTLCTFSMHDFLIEHLPLEAPPPHDISTDIDPFSEEPVKTPVSAGYYVELLSIVPLESLAALSRFLVTLLQLELEDIPRGLVSSATKRSQVHSSLEKGVMGIENMLKGMCLAYQEKDSVYGLVAGTYVMLHGMTSPTHPSGRRGQLATREMQEYSTLLEEALQGGRVSLEVGHGEGIESSLTCLVLPRQWAAFMKRVCDSFTKAHLLRRYPLSIWEDPTVLEEKSYEARDWTKQEIVKKLEELMKNKPSLSPVILFSLVGTVCATTFSTNKCGVVHREPVTAWSQVQLLRLTLTEIQNAITGDCLEAVSDHPLSILIYNLRSHIDKEVLLLTCPVIVETALCYSTIPPLPLTSSVEALVWCMWRHCNKYQFWYSGIVLNEVLVMFLPRIYRVELLTSELLLFADTSIQSKSLEQLCLASSLVPSLSITKQSDTCLQVLDSITRALQSVSQECLRLHHVQIASLHCANCCSLLYLMGVISNEQCMQYVTVLADLATKAPQVPAYYLGLGTILYGLLAASHPTILQLADAVAVRWIQQLSEKPSQKEVLSLTLGLAGLIGVNPVHEMLWYHDDTTPLGFVETLFPVLRDLFGKLCDECDTSVAVSITWLLGRIYQILLASSENEKVPKDYSYLPEKTLLPTLLSSASDAKILGNRSRVKCLVSAMSSTKISFPPCDFSTVMLPFIKIRELQVSCIQVIVNQSCMSGLRLLAQHVCNLMLRGILLEDAQLLLLENLPCFLNLVPVWKYVQPLCVSISSLYPNSQEQLQCLLKGLKGLISENRCISPQHQVDTGNIISDMWEEVCKKCTLSQLLGGQGKWIVRLFADCLSTVNYKAVPFDALPEKRFAFDCLLQCCWVESGKDGVTNLSPIIKWTFDNEGTEPGRITLGFLLEVLCHTSCDSRSKNSLVAQTELLHLILLWSRENEASVSQMYLVILLCLAVSSPTPLGYTDAYALDVDPWIASFSLPTSTLLQEKILQCLLEWLSYQDYGIHKMCLSLLESFTTTCHYNTPASWTTAAHLF